MAWIIPAATLAVSAYSAYDQAKKPHPGPMGGTSGSPQSYAPNANASSAQTILDAFQKSGLLQPKPPGTVSAGGGAAGLGTTPTVAGGPVQPGGGAPVPPSNPGPPANQTQQAAPQGQQPNPWLGQTQPPPTIAQAMRTYIA